MQQFLADRINQMEESQTIGMAKKARELAAKGVDVVNLTLGEPDFQTPQYIKDAAKKALDDGFTFYTPVPGFADLREAIAAKLRRDNNLPWEAENIVVSTGAKQSIANVILSLINPGEEVVVVGPFWVSYLEIIKLAEGVPVVVSGSIENDFKPSAADIEAAITPKTKAIIYSSPSNPTGSVFSKAELQAIAKVVAKHQGIFVIADEIYEYINFSGKHESIGTFTEIADRVITINGFSKGFAMTGWRVGYLAAAKWIADACDKIQGQFTSGTCSIAQKAAVAALTQDMSPTFEMAKTFLRRRDLMLSYMQEIPEIKMHTPEGAFYLFPDVSAYFGRKFGDKTMENSTDLSEYLLEHGHVSVVPGAAFGENNCIRLSFATSDENLRKAATRIKEALLKLN